MMMMITKNMSCQVLLGLKQRQTNEQNELQTTGVDQWVGNVLQEREQRVIIRKLRYHEEVEKNLSKMKVSRCNDMAADWK